MNHTGNGSTNCVAVLRYPQPFLETIVSNNFSQCVTVYLVHLGKCTIMIVEFLLYPIGSMYGIYANIGVY